MPWKNKEDRKIHYQKNKDEINRKRRKYSSKPEVNKRKRLINKIQRDNHRG